jgi:hypothetical protein
MMLHQMAKHIGPQSLIVRAVARIQSGLVAESAPTFRVLRNGDYWSFPEVFDKALMIRGVPIGIDMVFQRK